jgi:hypothetical protein
MKKVELTERQAVGLAGAIKLLEAVGWPPERVLPFVREVSTMNSEASNVDDSKMSRIDCIVVRFWFFHWPKNDYSVIVRVERFYSLLGSRWTLISAEGHTEQSYSILTCDFDAEGQACEVNGECFYRQTG